jgi:hypothetical protein
MLSDWLVKFVDGTKIIIGADTIDSAFKIAEQQYNKHVRSACFHSTAVEPEHVPNEAV